MMADEEKRSLAAESLTIESLMRTEHGRSWMWKRLQSCGVFETMFDRDPIKIAYNAGRRDAGLELDREIRESAPGYYVKMIEENIDG